MRSGEERPGPVPAPADWMRCEAIARGHGRTFYLASRCLPPARRRAVLATYAFCRIADDIVDVSPETGPDAAAAALTRWQGQVEHPDDPIAVAFAESRVRYGVPVRPVYDLLAGMRMDLVETRYASWADLRGYCYCVAGTVGLMVAPILGCREPDALTHAANLGIAMQLTNILRDVGDDAQRGRLYLPLDEVVAFGCNPEAILAGRPGHRFPDLIAFQIDRARALYADARRGFGALAPSGRLATIAASNLYAGILTAIEALDYDVFRTRAYVSPSRKLRAMPGVAATFLRHSLFPLPAVASLTEMAETGQIHSIVDAPTVASLPAGSPQAEYVSYG